MIVPPPNGDVCSLGRFDCRRIRDCADADKQNAITDSANSLFDVALLFLEREPVISGERIKPIRVVVSQQTAPKLDSLVPYSGATSLSDWVSGTQPTVMHAGYGVGSTGRDVGLARWYGGEGTGSTVMSCTGATQEFSGEVVVTYARDVTVDELPHNNLGELMALGPGAHAPGGGADVWTQHGDSGGPVIAGPVQGPTGSTSAFPAPMPSGTWGIIGIHSRGGGYADPALDGGSRPGSLDTATHDLAVSQWLVQQLGDRDGDAIPDAFDNCPDDHNPDQYDADGDAAGDQCDLCRCDPDEIDPNGYQGKSDGDGLCSRCDTSAPNDPEFRCLVKVCWHTGIDHCPLVNDPVEANCNAEAEIAMSARVLPDVCDPVPCPRFDSQEKSTTIVQKIPLGGVSKGYVGYLYVENSNTGKLNMTPVGAHRSPEKVSDKITDPAMIHEYEVTVDSTEYRYCVDVQGLVDCYDPANINDGKLRQEAERAVETAGSVWHRIWIDNLGIPKPSSAPEARNPLDLALNPYGPDTSADRTWNWEDDFTYWSTLSLWKDQLTYGVPSEAGQGKGRLWAHANTTHGMDLADAQHGIHGKASDHAVPQDGLANAVQDVSPISTKSRYVIQKLLTRVPLNLDFTVRPCLVCGTYVPEPGSLEHPDWGYPLAQVPGGSPFQAQQIVTIPGIGSPTLLLADGSLMGLSGIIGQGLQESLALGVRWADAVEVNPAAGSGALAPSAVGLGSTNNTIVERLYVRSGALLGQEDVSPTHGPVTRLASPVAVTSQEGPEARTDPVVVYSRSSRRLFLVGGRSKDAGNVLTDIWWADVDTGSWNMVPVQEATFGSVIAATWSPSDGRLWVLDEVGGGMSPRARLSRLHPGTGIVELLGEWPRTGKFDRHWLMLDRDNSVLLAASSEKVNKHVVLRLAHADSGLQVTGSFASQHTLALPPLVDGEGYAFTIQVAAHKMPAVVRLRKLTGGIGHWGGIGACL